MKALIRTDSSYQIGTGHVMRCLTLAEVLKKQGTDVIFVCRALPGNISDMITARGFRLHLLPYDRQALLANNASDQYAKWLVVEKGIDAAQTARILTTLEKSTDWLIVDHYGLDAVWESSLQQHVDGILAIDDLANRRHVCDILVDQNLYSAGDRRYHGLVPNDTTVFAGPEWALLRDEFAETRQRTNARDGLVDRVLVFYGGADATHETDKALTALSQLDSKIAAIDVVIGRSNRQRNEIIALAQADRRVTVHENATNMAQLMARADLGLGAGGTTTWERCCVGLPTIITTVADNQVEIAREADLAGIARYIGQAEHVSAENLAATIDAMIDNPPALAAMSRSAMRALEGHGARRVVEAMKSLSISEVRV